MKKPIKFVLVKLAVLAVVDIVGIVTALVAKLVIGGLPIAADEAVLSRAVGIAASAIAGLVCFIYTYSTVTKMKKIGNGSTVFALKETAVYVLFLLPLAVGGIVGVKPELFSGFFGIAYAPHIAPALAGLNPAVGALIYAVLFFGVNYLAANKNKRKAESRAALPTDSEPIETGNEEA